MTTGLSERRPGAAGAGSARPRAGGTAALDVAILLATSPGDDGEPAALLRWEDTTILARLVALVAGAAAAAARVLTRRGWQAALGGGRAGAAAGGARAGPAGGGAPVGRSARQGGGRLLIAQGQVATQREPLAGLALAPRG